MDPIAQEILDLVKIKMEEQGAYDRDAYKEIVDETIEYFRERGKISDEENDELIADELMMMWEEVEQGFSEESKNAEENEY